MLLFSSFLRASLVSLLAFSVHGRSKDPPQTPFGNDPASREPLRIAIVGAGAAGSSAAYHLYQYSSQYHIPINITIYDPNTDAGGRSTTVNALNDPDYPTELGASIFVKINHILYNSVQEFGLGTAGAGYERPKESDYSLGVWDGKQFVFTQKNEERRWSGYWDIAKMLWKFGLAPIRTQRLAKDAVGRFLKLYEEPLFPFRDLTDAVQQADLLGFTGTTGEQTLEVAGVGELFGREIIQASTRVNYGQNLAQIHGLEALVCMAIEGAMAVEGGNWQIFHEMVKRSHAVAYFNTTVTEITSSSNDLSYRIKSMTSKLQTSNGFDPQFETSYSSLETIMDEEFDTVIVAAPLQFSNITIIPPLSNPPEPIPYVTLYVTLLTSPYRLSPLYFGLIYQNDVPETVITTLPEDVHPGTARGIDAVGPAGFWSISTLRTIKREGQRTQYLYKVFSPAPLTGSRVADLLDFEYQNVTVSDPLSEVSEQDISWLCEKKWNSYPYEVPRVKFEALKLDSVGDRSGIYYTSGIESFISTMETSALMGKNVARLIMDDEAWHAWSKMT